MNTIGSLPLTSTLGFRKGTQLGDLSQRQSPGLGWHLRQFFQNGIRQQKQKIATDFGGKLLGLVQLASQTAAMKFSPDFSRLQPERALRLRQLLALNIPVQDLAREFPGTVVDYGTISYRVVTDTGVAYLANNFAAGGQLIANFKFHGFGTGTTAEAAGDSALVTELTTQYNPDSTRPTGSQSSSAGVYTTVGTLSPDSGGTIAITEHGIFSASSAGTLWDRSKFSAINLVAGSDSLQVTYALTLTSGG